MKEMKERQCRLAVRQCFIQDGEKETALHTGRGILSVEDGIVRLCVSVKGEEEMAAQTISFPTEDPTAVTAESGRTRLIFPGEGRAAILSEKILSEKILVDTPAGTFSFDFTPLSVENSISPEDARGALLLRYRLSFGDAHRDAEVRYTLLG